MTAPLRARFGAVYRLDYYDSQAIQAIVRRATGKLAVQTDEGGIEEIARRARGTPRVALRLLRRVRDYAQVRADGIVTRAVAKEALDLLAVDPLGLDDLDRRVLKTVIQKYQGGPVGLNTIAAAISEEPETETLNGLKTSRWGSLVINPESYITNEAGVFGGGDVVTGPSTVIEAIAAGKNAAIMMDRYMAGKQLKKLNKVVLPTVYVAPVSAEDEGEAAGRIHPEHLPVAARVKNFKEVDLCPSENHALCEARRCLRCDIEFTQPAMN